jgi:hypothetical protein
MSEIRNWGTIDLLLGSLDPDGIAIVLAAGGLIPDTSLVTAITLVGVDKLTGAAVTWTTTFTAQSTTEVTAVYYLQATDTNVPKVTRFVIWATRTGAAHPIQCGILDVKVSPP